MSTYYVTYFYLATGMEGEADRRDLGRYAASSPRDAVDQAIERHYGDYSPADKSWVRSCLTARQIN